MEFLKIKFASNIFGQESLDNLRLESYKYLVDHAKSLPDPNATEEQQKQAEAIEQMKPLEEVSPYSQVDQLYFQCGLLEEFANQPLTEPAVESLESRRAKKLKTKQAYRCIL